MWLAADIILFVGFYGLDFECDSQGEKFYIVFSQAINNIKAKVKNSKLFTDSL